MSSAFKQKLSDDQTEALEEILKTLEKEQLYVLTEMLFECIILAIDIPQKDEDYVDMSRIR